MVVVYLFLEIRKTGTERLIETFNLKQESFLAVNDILC